MSGVGGTGSARRGVSGPCDEPEGAGRRLELGELPSFEPKSFPQHLHGVGVWPAALPALEQADGLGGEARPRGQLLLRHPGRGAVAPQ